MNCSKKVAAKRDFRMQDYMYQRWIVSVAPDVTLDDVLDPGYLVNVTHMINPGDLISIISTDFSLDALARILSVTSTAVEMRVLEVYASPNGDEITKDVIETSLDPNDYELKYSGGRSGKWRILNGNKVETTVGDNGNFSSKEEAQSALDALLSKTNT